MIFVENAKPGPFTLQLYEMLLREACWRDDLYFIAYANLPIELFDDRCHLKFHYTNQ